jgi:hypothetical protein
MHGAVVNTVYVFVQRLVILQSHMSNTLMCTAMMCLIAQERWTCPVRRAINSKTSNFKGTSNEI